MRNLVCKNIVADTIQATNITVTKLTVVQQATIGTLTMNGFVRDHGLDLKEEILNILKGCAGRRTPEVVAALMQITESGLSRWFCTDCYSSRMCGHIKDCNRNGKWAVERDHRECISDDCMCNCHWGRRKDQERGAREGLLRLASYE